jgi:CRP/FNR family cyclic AMP-dependent transcriptional regulator
MAMIDILKQSDLFGALDAAHLNKVATYSRGVSYREGEMIFREGDAAAELYILTDGRVALEMEVRPVPNRPAIPTALEVVSKNEFFGWSALVEPYVFTLSARCMTRCTAVAIKGDMFRKTMNDDPVLGYEIMKALCKLLSLRLANTRLRLISGIGLVLLDKELKLSQ